VPLHPQPTNRVPAEGWFAAALGPWPNELSLSSEAGWEGGWAEAGRPVGEECGWLLNETQLHFNGPSCHKVCCDLPGRRRFLLINLLRE
jgi:hypothetical protein